MITIITKILACFGYAWCNALLLVWEIRKIKEEKSRTNENPDS